MKEYKIPFGHGFQTISLQDANLLEPNFQKRTDKKNEEDIVLAALRNPIASEPLSELARGKRNAVIIISDHTRPVPSKKIIPFMLTELRRNNPGIDITLLVATGCHRGTVKEELVRKLGEDIVNSEKIVVHDCADAQNNVAIGVLPSGAPLVINRIAAEADLLVSEGFIEPHFFAGFSGGRKSILPGVCDRKTVLGNHCSKFIDHPAARTGILENNPIHIDMIAACRLARLRFIVNVLIDEEKKVIAAFAGHPELAHLAGCKKMMDLTSVDAIPADIIITSNGGAPLDQNIYQSVKGMTAGEASINPGGIIILCAECKDGIGGDAFYRSLSEAPTIDELYQSILKVPMSETIPDQWQVQVLARILCHHEVVFVTLPEHKAAIEAMKMTYAPSVEEAFAYAKKKLGDSATVTVIPNGVSVIVKAKA